MVLENNGNKVRHICKTVQSNCKEIDYNKIVFKLVFEFKKFKRIAWTVKYGQVISVLNFNSDDLSSNTT